MTLNVGDYVCSKSSSNPDTDRVYQIVKISPRSSGFTPSVEAYGILDYSCNPRPRWGSFSMMCSLDNLVRVPDLMILARVAEGEYATGRPQYYEDAGVWTEEEWDEARRLSDK